MKRYCVVNTRAAAQQQPLTALCQARGWDVIEFPCIRFEFVNQSELVDILTSSTDPFSWIVLTSANSVKAVATAICGKELLLPPVACVGDATADEARKHLLIEPAFVSQRATGKDLANGLPILDGARILIPQSSLASDDVARILTQRGARIDCVTAYETTPIGDGGHVCEAVSNGDVDVVIVTSPSTLNAFLDAMRAGGVDDAALGRLAFAPIGPTTASCVEEKLLHSLPISTEHSLEGMLDCIASYFDRLEAPKRAK